MGCRLGSRPIEWSYNNGGFEINQGENEMKLFRKVVGMALSCTLAIQGGIAFAGTITGVKVEPANAFGLSPAPSLVYKGIFGQREFG